MQAELLFGVGGAFEEAEGGGVTLLYWVRCSGLGALVEKGVSRRGLLEHGGAVEEDGLGAEVDLRALHLLHPLLARKHRRISSSVERRGRHCQILIQAAFRAVFREVLGGRADDGGGVFEGALVGVEAVHHLINYEWHLEVVSD